MKDEDYIQAAHKSTGILSICLEYNTDKDGDQLCDFIMHLGHGHFDKVEICERTIGLHEQPMGYLARIYHRGKKYDILLKDSGVLTASGSAFLRYSKATFKKTFIVVHRPTASEVK